ncbi:SOS response-associated peptidase family protein, partial [Pseudomonas peli]|uniref:SOS response-associated peptidase family protein n=1 Tax=Pseudomonas peli TaxID=592361 RepID=UPI003D311AB0
VYKRQFYEWRGTARKRPYWLTGESTPLFFAALWEAYPVEGCVYLSAAVVTQAAERQRRPLILDRALKHIWRCRRRPTSGRLGRARMIWNG